MPRAELHRTTWRSIAVLVFVTAALVALSFLESGSSSVIHHAVEPLVVLAAMLWFLRQSLVKTRRAASEASQKARLAALLDSALGSSPVAFAFFDPQLRFLRVNTTFAKMTGVDLYDHVGKTLWDIDRAVASSVEPRLKQVLSRREPMTNVEYRMETPTSRHELRDLLSSYYPIVTPDGELFGIGAAVVDVTDVKRLEEQLVQAQKMEAVGRLAGGVAHDFNNLLTVISSYAELILFDPAMQDREEIVEIRGAAARAAKLTRQLLAFSRRQAMEPRIVNPNDVLRGVEGLLSRLIDHGVDVRSNLSPETPLIRVDPGQLEQVVMNLAINAADAMPEGGRLTIETSGEQVRDELASHEPDLAPGTYAVIRVRDTGHGMDAVTQAQIFDPFFTTKEPGRGTGLGLSTVYGIVKQSNGTVTVESAPGEGSVFTVYLPAVDERELNA